MHEIRIRLNELLFQLRGLLPGLRNCCCRISRSSTSAQLSSSGSLVQSVVSLLDLPGKSQSRSKNAHKQSARTQHEHNELGIGVQGRCQIRGAPGRVVACSKANVSPNCSYIEQGRGSAQHICPMLCRDYRRWPGNLICNVLFCRCCDSRCM